MLSPESAGSDLRESLGYLRYGKACYWRNAAVDGVARALRSIREWTSNRGMCLENAANKIGMRCLGILL